MTNEEVKFALLSMRDLAICSDLNQVTSVLQELTSKDIFLIIKFTLSLSDGVMSELKSQYDFMNSSDGAEC
jgi:hypothetical protein